MIKANKYSLALHTTSPELGLSLSNFAGDTRTGVWNLGRDLSTHLHQYLTEFIKPQSWSDLEFIAVAKGPGSFTGTRIGVVTARVISQQFELPLFSISSLEAICWEKKQKEKTIAVQMDARREQIFGSIYRVAADNFGLKAELPDTTMDSKQWEEILANLKSNYHLINAPTNLGSTVSSILELAYLNWQEGKRPHCSEALPFYGQHPV